MEVIIGFFICTLVYAVYYYLVFVAKTPKVYSSNTRMKKFLTAGMPILKKRYFPSPFFWLGSLQTAFSQCLRALPHALKFEIEIFPLSDGGQLGLETLVPDSGTERCDAAPVVLVLGGVTGHSKTSYIQTLGKAIQKAGCTTVFFNNRGFGGVPLTTPKTHNSRSSEDLREVAQYVKKCYSGRQIVALGISFGGLIICHYMNDYPEEAAKNFGCVLLICSNWNHYNCMLNLEKSFINRIFNSLITYDLLRLTQRFEETLNTQKGIFNWKAIRKSKTIRQFESTMTLPQYHKKSLHDYWTDCIINPMAHYPIPVFALHAQDDPLIPGKDLPINAAIGEGSNLALIVTARGGHLGFLEGISLRAQEEHYMERFTTQILKAISAHSVDFYK